jgi:predicted NUDIX family NTP pyrophosphohydrolase
VPRLSAGILLWRNGASGIEVLLVHPGGPYWARKDDGAWSIPKGEADEGEPLLAVALRELEEETGLRPAGEPMPLGSARQAGGKWVHAWAIRGDADPASIRSNEFELEWPPRSGRVRRFPEIDRAAWFAAPQARRKLLKGQLPLLEALLARVAPGGSPEGSRSSQSAV